MYITAHTEGLPVIRSTCNRRLKSPPLGGSIRGKGFRTKTVFKETQTLPFFSQKTGTV